MKTTSYTKRTLTPSSCDYKRTTVTNEQLQQVAGDYNPTRN